MYLDDVIVFGKTFEEHQYHLRSVLNAIRCAKLALKLEKCQFAVYVMVILGHVIDRQGLHPDSAKQAAVRAFPRPYDTRKLREFLGLANYYSRFVARFASITQPPHELLKKSHVWNWQSWSDTVEEAFQKFKVALTSSPVPMPFHDDLPCEI